MRAPEVHQCECATCQQELAHPDQALHHRINLLVSRLDEQQRRWYVAMESDRIGPGGDEVLSQITGMNPKTNQRGRQELASGLVDRPHEQVRVSGGGRQRAEKKMHHEKARWKPWCCRKPRGDPRSEQKWVRSSLRHLSQRWKLMGHQVSPPTVGRL